MIRYSEVSIIVPCKNEANNILTLNELMGVFPTDLELILVEGGSQDDTAHQCEVMAASYPDFVRVVRQTQKGKMNAVMEGILESSRNHIAIFDADLTVSLHDQLKLIDAYCEKNGSSFVTGNRINRKMHSGSMQLANLIANYTFGLLFSALMRNRIVDTLCGTKIFPKVIILEPRCKKIVLEDPFGDFAMLSNAWLFGLKVESINVEYLPRRYGATNIRRWTSGLMLCKIFIIFFVNHGFSRIKNIGDSK